MFKFFNKKSSYFSSLKWGFYSIVINFGKQILLVPAFIICVGKEDYTFWLIISTIVLMIRAINLGQLNYTSNEINLRYHIQDDIQKELILGQGSNVIFVLIQILIGIIISFPLLLSFFSGLKIPYLLSINAQFCFLYLVLSRIIYQYCTLYLLRLFEPIGKINITVKYQTIGELVDFIVTVIVVYFTHSLLWTCFAIFVSNLLFSVFLFYYITKNLPFKVPMFKGVNYLESFDLIKKSMLFSVSFIIEKVYEIGLNLVVVKTFSSAIVPLFSTNRVMSNSALKVSSVMAVPLMPDIQKQYALQNDDLITKKMIVFWKISGSIIILSISIALPFLPYLYKIWTANKIEFNFYLIAFLMMAIVFQNYATIFVEFLKKTNRSVQMLFYNIIKVITCIIGLFFAGQYDNHSGIGLALLMGEIFGIIYLILIMASVFNGQLNFSVYLQSLTPLIVFSISTLCYMYFKQYILFIVPNLCIIGYMNLDFLKQITRKFIKL